MGLLEKAGKMQDEPAKKAAPKKAAKASKPKPKAERKPREKRTREPRQRKERVPKVMPKGYEPAGKAAKGARRLVDFLVTYGGIFAVLGAFAYVDGDFTYFWILAFALMLVNIAFLPWKTNRTVGMFLTRTRFINHKDKHPHWSHQVFRNLTALFVLAALIFIAMGAAAVGGPDWKLIGIGGAIAIIPFSNYVITKLRFANGHDQNMWDMMYSCWMVKATAAEKSEGGGWMGRLESLGDWGESRGWTKDSEESGES